LRINRFPTPEVNIDNWLKIVLLKSVFPGVLFRHVYPTQTPMIFRIRFLLLMSFQITFIVASTILPTQSTTIRCDNDLSYKFHIITRELVERQTWEPGMNCVIQIIDTTLSLEKVRQQARSRSFSDFYPMIRKLAIVAFIGVVVVAAIVLRDYPPSLTVF
jgi:hypothetical protein